ncbi:YjjG family noncanonical pyrimidine nucleotidase [Streptococcus didelphis]|uniref:YjjG family noncanonical pyrimidine nucleotidase n=1 Tax=Streptococcus didelphis TaxID=102886 RepID=A0ABY9LH39_9STRE|nr:YjjG family noncanonical pyrimidine nucleotidase [Streptococcus didelphis]WMB28187.1 YjjG family noncanonical pyrimidine nucleotidase [Streptococcus didelphis]WMB30098.1 YjjG family noncanonical pyrimidine nucleotidase [Streptococcus didelphis]
MEFFLILFDLDHTLLDFDLAEEVALTELLKEYNVKDIAAYKNYYRPMNKAMWRALELKEMTKSELVNTRFAKLFAHFNIEVDGVSLAQTYQTHLQKQGQTYSGAAELLKALSTVGYQLFAVTNGITDIQMGCLQASDIKHYFSDIFISEQAASQKPDKYFFDWIGQRIPHYQRHKTLMIGDSLTADIQGGNNAGIDTVWYNPNHLQNNSNAQTTFEISSFKELGQLLLPQPS